MESQYLPVRLSAYATFAVACGLLSACDQLITCSVAASRIEPTLRADFQAALGGAKARFDDVATFRLTDVKESSSSQSSRSCKATLSVELKPGVWDKMKAFMASPSTFDSQLQRDMVEIDVADKFAAEKINQGAISLDYEFDVRYEAKEPEFKAPLEGKGSAIYGASTPVKLVSTYLRMSARALDAQTRQGPPDQTAQIAGATQPAQSMALGSRSTVEPSTTPTNKSIGRQAASTAGPSSPPPTPLESASEDVMSIVTKYEACGEEALCLSTAKGNTVWMQASQMRKMDYALLDKAIATRAPVCLRSISRTEGKNFTADGLDSEC